MINDFQTDTFFFFLAMSRYTKRPYIDAGRNSYAFSSDKDADRMEKDLNKTEQHVYFIKKKCSRLKKCLSDCYAAGAYSITMRNHSEEKKYTLDEQALERRFYNNRLNGDIAGLLHAKDKHYLYDMASCIFIVPVRITNYPELRIVYATAVLKEKPYMYLCFSDLNEYAKWETRVKGWKPLGVNAYSLKRIGKKHGYILNIYGEKLMLTKEMLAAISIAKNES